MPALHKNRVKMTVTSAPGTSSPVTLVAASTGHQSFATAYGANATVDVLISNGTDWEVQRGVTYTHSGTTVSRGTPEASSNSGSLVNFSSATNLTVEEIATAGFGNSIESALQAVTPGGRLTLESGVPVSTTDQTAKTSIYYTPYVHNIVNLWDGANWVPTTFPEFAGALGTITNARPYDVFSFRATLTPSSTDTGTDIITFGAVHNLWTGAHCRSNATIGGLTIGTDYWVNVASTTTISLHTTLANALAGTSKVDLTASITQSLDIISQEQLAWTNDTTRATAVTLQDGRYCKSGDKTRLLLGTFYTTSTTTTEDSYKKRLVWNTSNRVIRGVRCTDSTVSWTLSVTSYRYARNDSNNRIEFMRGIAGDVDNLLLAQFFIGNPPADVYVSGIGFNSSSASIKEGANGTGFGAGARANILGADSPQLSVFAYTPTAGYNFYAWIEKTITGSTMTAYGNNECGIVGSIMT